MKKIELPNNAQYRDDIGEKLEKDLPKLQNFGFAVGMKYKKD